MIAASSFVIGFETNLTQLIIRIIGAGVSLFKILLLINGC